MDDKTIKECAAKADCTVEEFKRAIEVYDRMRRDERVRKVRRRNRPY